MSHRSTGMRRRSVPDTEGDTPDLPQGEKLQQLERGSRQLRRSRVKDGGDPSGAAPTQDW